MEKNTTAVCLHHLAGLLGNLQEHLIELEIQAYQLAQVKQRLKFTDLPAIGLSPYFIFAPAQYLPPFAFALVFGKVLILGG
jgi:hypothetical protein